MDHSKLGKDKALPEKPDSVFPTARLISHESDNSTGRIPKLRICLRPNNQDTSLSSPSSQEDDVKKGASNSKFTRKRHKGANSLVDESSLDSNSYDSEETKNLIANTGDEKRLSLPIVTSQQSKDPSFTPNITMTRRKSALAKLQSNEFSKETKDAPKTSVKLEKTISALDNKQCEKDLMPDVKIEIAETSNKIVADTSSLIESQTNNQNKLQFKRCTRRTSLQEKNGRLVDLVNPDSVLTKVNFKTLINKATFESLPPSLQFQLTKLLPDCDKTEDEQGVPRAHQTAFQNEFLAKALSDFPKRIKSGEFVKVNDSSSEHEVDKWKLDYFEEYWGQSSECGKLNDKPDDVFSSNETLKLARSSTRRKRLLPTCPKMITRKTKHLLILEGETETSIANNECLKESSSNVKQELSDTSQARVPPTATDSFFTPKFTDDKDLPIIKSQQTGTPMTLRRQRVPTRRWRQHQEERRRMRDMHKSKNSSVSEPSRQPVRLDATRSSSITSPSGSSGEAESALSGFSKPSPPTSKPQISNIITTSPLPVSRSPRSPMPPPIDQLTCRTGSDIVSRVPSGPSSTSGPAVNEPIISPMAPPRKTKTLAAVREKMRALRQLKEQRATPLAQHGCNSDMGLLTSPLSPSALLSTFEDDSLDRMSASLSSLGHCDSNNSIPTHDSLNSSQPFNINDIQFDQHLLDPSLSDDNLVVDKQLPADLFADIDHTDAYSPSISSKLSNIEVSGAGPQKKCVGSILPGLLTPSSSQILADKSDNDTISISGESSKVSNQSEDKQKNNLPQQQFVLIPNPKNSSLILCRATPIYSPGVSPETGEAHSFIIHTANGPVALINTQNSNQLSHASLLSAIAKSLNSKDDNTTSVSSDVSSNAATSSSNSSSIPSNTPGTIDESVSQKLIEAVRSKIAMTLNNQNKSASSTVVSEMSKPLTCIQSVTSSQNIIATSQCLQMAPIPSQPSLHTTKGVPQSANNPTLSSTVQPQIPSIITSLPAPPVTSSTIIRNGYPVNSTSQVMLRTLQPSFNLQVSQTPVQIQERPTLNANIIRPRNFAPFVSTMQGPSNNYGIQSLQQILQNSDSSVRQGIPSQYIMGTFQTSSANHLSTVTTPFVKNPSDQTSVPLQLLFNANQIASPVIVGGMHGSTPIHLPVNMSPALQPQYVSNIKTTSLQPVVASVSGSLHPAYRPTLNQNVSDVKAIKRKNKPLSKIPTKRRKSVNTKESSADVNSIPTQSVPIETPNVPGTSDVTSELMVTESLAENNSEENISNQTVNRDTQSSDSLPNEMDGDQLSNLLQNSTSDSVDNKMDSENLQSNESLTVIYESDISETPKEKSTENCKDDSMKPSESTSILADTNSPYGDGISKEKGEDIECVIPKDNIPSNSYESKNNSEEHSKEISETEVQIENTQELPIESDSLPCEIEVRSNTSAGNNESLAESSIIKESNSTIDLPSHGINVEFNYTENETTSPEFINIHSKISDNLLTENKSILSEGIKDNAYDSDNALDLSMPSITDPPNDTPLDLTTQDKSSCLSALSTGLKASDSIMEPKTHLVADILNQHSSLSSDSQTVSSVTNTHAISMLTSSNSSV